MWVRICALHFLNTHFQPGHRGGTKMCGFFFFLFLAAPGLNCGL